MSEGYQIQDLLALMARLRDPQQGCPWDLKQTWQTIVPHTLEEAYEVAECIEQQDYQHLQEELGDLLFQVVYYARFAEEEGRYDFATIVDQLTAKLIRRHPHVFPSGTLNGLSQQKTPVDADAAHPSFVDEQQVKQRWEAIKAEERQAAASLQQPVSVLDAVPIALPAMTRAVKLQKRAASVGFDWAESLAVVDKMQEELDEIRAALASGEQAAVADEVGDFIFATLNLARHLKVDPEQALRGTNRKFTERFQQVERLSAAAGAPLTLERQADPEQAVTLEQMEAYWQQAKQIERTKQG
ncbi:nucleoside triphosphate pyrophosphohydrolase [Marinospirillum sp. MEB164]|uniref:Nucleoside triphosphate pyrophosphohydrolase n=1 Tax=Marinospirillum alkalitolerans TaxID=3123374 RepID=A0ABW8PVT4_9GAMM